MKLLKLSFVPTAPLSICLIFGLIGCNEGSSGSSDFFIPDIELACDSAQASDCSTNNLEMKAGLLADTREDCEAYLSQISAANFAISFDASGDTTGVFANSLLTGFVTHWVNSQSQSVTDLEQKTYLLCAFVDTNGNGELDSGEPVGEGRVSMGVSSDTIDDWFNAQ